jgi:methyl-accepting chemotaxis protein
VAQVNKAMARVDEVTQRNASAAEELASTAEEMAAQAEGLQQLVAHFRLPGTEAGARLPMASAFPAPGAPARPGKGIGARHAGVPVAVLAKDTLSPRESDYRPF